MPSQELMFLQCCLQARWNPGALATARDLSLRPGFDWAKVQALAQREGVAPLLYVLTREAALLPATVLDDLRAIYFQTARRNLLLFRELAQALGWLAEAGIPVLVLKGVTLAETVYDNPAVRPMSDVDLLIHPEHAAPAVEVLTARGYIAPELETRAGETLMFENEVLLYKDGAVRVNLELHWGLFDSPFYQQTLPLAWFWETARPLNIEGFETRMLGPEALALHLCGHLMLHHGAGERLRGLWLHDIAEVLARFEPASWALLLEKARDFQLILAVQHAFAALETPYPGLIPKAIAVRLGELTPSAEEAQVFQWLTAEQRPVVQRFWADLVTLPNWRARLRYGWHSLFPSPAYMLQRYGKVHPAWLPLLYPYRWLKGVGEWLRKK